MCKRDQPRYLTFYHRIVIDDPDNIPLDTWLTDTIPDDYHVCGFAMDKIITDAITFIYTVVVELNP